ncbi:MAG: branched-chain amino acid ABC transporter permease [Acidimicrobiia bacterium]|nr:branched-chain amino acid ABC transporter permease [Acidimicrobiia bacterium]MBT8191831.1 branched-chain amino acid ABC transporter permease [Acidimicrobiia bacterium]NNF89151.1 branched-chain amino acid ABC transporter permease [Acidimicrobiia bacterium]NNL14928.1 branched-chain amino acid ABC transporter permease [Acidimicrobiia bacterium]NNL97639.1 branched-chain amino acid ABC transporter permease [Acidimicrobiia bacterium]
MTAQTTEKSLNKRVAEVIEENRARVTVLAVLLFLFLAAFAGLEREDWFAVIMQGLSIGAITFLVASGLSLIFGLMDVLNLAHGEIFMLGAYVGWTVYTRFDTALDIVIPLLFLAAPFVVMPVWRKVSGRLPTDPTPRRVASWALLAVGAVVTWMTVTRFPLAIWDSGDFTQSPGNFSTQVGLGILAPLTPDTFQGAAVVAVVGLLIGGSLLAIGISAFQTHVGEIRPVTRRQVGTAATLIVAAIVLSVFKDSLNQWAFDLSTTWRFFLAMAISVGVGVALGAFIEVLLIRPLYDRPIYQLMLTLGVGFILIEVVRDVWGRPEFSMARPALFNGTGEGCPGQGLGGFFSGCSTVQVFGARLRVYNEGFVILVGLIVLVGVTMLLKRTRIGMIIRAGVQDPDMVEVLGINVRRVFTLVFALGCGLAALGGVLAAPSIGLSTGMGALFLLGALIAMAIGGLTSFPGAAAGAVLVGLLQTLIIRFGQVGINIPFLAEPFEPSPTLVPAASIILMVIVLLVLPSGLFGRGER